jgi:hypothetical protein
MNILIIIISFLYASTGIISAIGYIPTIRDLTRNVASANINSYIIWTFCSLISFIYSILAIGDLLLEIVTGLNFAACAVILAMTLNLKYRQRKTK